MLVAPRAPQSRPSIALYRQSRTNSQSLLSPYTSCPSRLPYHILLKPVARSRPICGPPFDSSRPASKISCAPIDPNMILYLAVIAGLTMSPLSTSAMYTNGTTIPFNTTSLPRYTTVTTLPDIMSCIDAKHSWIANSSEYETELIINSVVQTSTVTSIDTAYSLEYITSTITHLANSTAYTLCDGFPRLNGYTSMTTRTKTLPSTTILVATLTSEALSTIILHSAPACVIPSSDCHLLKTSWTAWNSAYSSSLAAWSSSRIYYNATVKPPPYTFRSPICGAITTPVPIETGTVGAPICYVPAASVRLLYWPVSTVSGDICRGNGSTNTMSATVPGQVNSFTTLNTTLYSPTVYIEVLGTWNYKSGSMIMTKQSVMLIPQPPTSVSSSCGNALRSVNYADFNYPVPASAYRCQPKCMQPVTAESVITTQEPHPGATNFYTTYQSGTQTFTETIFLTTAFNNTCSTIWDDYAPALSVPQQFLDMHPFSVPVDGVTCAFTWNEVAKFYDPPTALISQTSAAELTTPVVATPTFQQSTPSTTAQPANSVDPGPSATVGSTASVQSTSSLSQNPASSPFKTNAPSSAVPENPSTAAAPISTSSALEEGPLTDPSIFKATPLATAQTSRTIAESNSKTGNNPSLRLSSVGSSSTQDVGGIIASILDLTRTSDGSTGRPPMSPINQGASQASLKTSSESSSWPSLATSDPSSSVSTPTISSQIPAASISVQALSQESSNKPPIPVITFAQPNEVTALSSPDVAATPATGIVLTQGNGVEQTIKLASQSEIALHSTILPLNVPVSSPGIGEYSFGAQVATASGTTVAYSALATRSSSATLPDTIDGTSAFGSQSIDSSITQTLGTAPSPAAVVIGTHTYTADTGGVYNLGPLSSLAPGGPDVVISGTTYSIPTSASDVLVNGMSQPHLKATTGEATIAHHTFTADISGVYVVETPAILSPGGSPITISGTTMSLALSNDALIINGFTQLDSATVGEPSLTANPLSTLTGAPASMSSRLNPGFSVSSLASSTPAGAPPGKPVASSTASARSMLRVWIWWLVAAAIVALV